MKIDLTTKTLPQLFEQAALHVTRAALPEQTIGAALREKLGAQGADPSALLKNWLTEVLRAIAQDRMAFSRFEVRQLGPRDGGWIVQVEATGELIGRAQDPRPAPLTCSAAEISGTEDHCQAAFTLAVAAADSALQMP